MPRITGLIDADNLINGTLQIKPNQAFLGMTMAILEFPVIDSQIDITIPATPYDIVYLVGLKSDNNIFKPLEQWTVPVEDCTIQQIRNISLAYISKLEKDLKNFKQQTYSLINQVSDFNNELLSSAQANRTLDQKLKSEQQRILDYIREVEFLKNRVKHLTTEIQELKNPAILPPPNQKQKVSPSDVSANLLRRIS